MYLDRDDRDVLKCQKVWVSRFDDGDDVLDANAEVAALIVSWLDGDDVAFLEGLLIYQCELPLKAQHG